MLKKRISPDRSASLIQISFFLSTWDLFYGHWRFRLQTSEKWNNPLIERRTMLPIIMYAVTVNCNMVKKHW